MYTDPVLTEKDRVQKKLCLEADYDINKLFDNMHNIVVGIAKKSKTALKYSNRKGGYVNVGNDDFLNNSLAQPNT